jgi:hypothetical protein
VDADEASFVSGDVSRYFDEEKKGGGAGGELRARTVPRGEKATA